MFRDKNSLALASLIDPITLLPCVAATLPAMGVVHCLTSQFWDDTRIVCNLLYVCVCVCAILCVLSRRHELGLSEDVKLLPASEADAVAAQIALNQQSGIKYQDSHQNKRTKIMTESIFGQQAPQPGRQLAGGSSSGGAGSSRALVPSSSRPPQPKKHRPVGSSGLAALAGAAAGSSKAAALQKQQLQQRVLLAKQRKKQG
jgi:hypothetical protein